MQEQLERERLAKWQEQDRHFEHLLKESQKISEKYQAKSHKIKLLLTILIHIISPFIFISMVDFVPIISDYFLIYFVFVFFCIYYIVDIIIKYLSFLWRDELISSANKLSDYDNPKISGVLLHVIFAAPPKIHKAFVPKATELLYALKQTHVSGFTAHQRQCLYDLVREPRWARQYPDLVAAAMTAVLDMGTDEGYKALLAASNRKEKRKQDQWVQDAAKACLERWRKN
jgi:hypothetical protein